MPKIYSWNKVDKKTGKVLETLRKVSIDPPDADELNHDWKVTGFRYDLVEDEKKLKDGPAVPPAEEMPVETKQALTGEEYKASLIEQIKKLGGNPSPNAKVETLELKLLELKNQNK